MKLLAVLSLIVVLGIPFLVSAQGQTALSDTGFENICSKRLTDSTESQFALGKCVANLYKLSLGLGAIVALFMIVISGYRYMNAAGNAQQVEGAKDSFSHAFIGLIIILVAYALLYTINPDLVKFRAVELPPIVFQPPSPPTGGTGTAACSQILLTWQDNSNDEDGFHIWRFPAPVVAAKLDIGGRTYQRIGQTAANTKTYTDIAPDAGQNFYAIAAFKDAADSQPATAGPIAPTPCN